MPERSARRWAVGVAAFGVLAATPAAATGTPAKAKPTPAVTTRVGPAVPAGPALSIAVDDGRPAANRGDHLTYTVTVRNIGSVPVRGLRITQTLPVGFTAVVTDPAADTVKGQFVWTRDVPAGKDTAVTTAGTLAALPAGQQRLAVVACAAAGSAGRPSVCAADSDLLPAAALPVAAVAAGRSGGGGGGAPGWLLPGAGGLVVVLGAGGAVLAVHRRRFASRRVAA